MPESVAKKEWEKANTTRIQLKLNNNTDKDILAKLNTVPSKQGYIRSLIRKDIAGTQKQK